jgi:PAS domain S-box-containing protein
VKEFPHLADSVFRDVVETTSDATVVHVAGRIVYANPAFAALLRVSGRESLYGEPLIDFISPACRPRAAARLERQLRGEENPTEILQVLARGGSEADVEVSATHIDIEGTTATAVLMRDVSDRIRAEREARASHERAELVMRATNDAIWEWDVAHDRIVWNHAMSALFGWNVEQTTFAWWMERVHDDDRDRVSSSILRAVDDGDVVWSARYRFRRSDDSTAWILDRGYVLRDDDGNPLRMTGSMTDVSELHRALEERASLQAMLEQANRVAGLGRVAATIAHEFNNVLMAIQPYAEILRRRAADMPEVERPASQIIQAVKRGKRVTDEILRFTRPSETALTRLNLRTFLTRLAQHIEELNLPNIGVRIEQPDEDVFVLGDVAQLEQVAVNLIVNARDAMPHGGTLTIAAKKNVEIEAGFLSAAEAESFACISFTDTGDGIPPAVIGKIFEPLFTTKPRGGTGLGLAVAQQIVTSHGGYLTVSSAVGAGTTFHMLLPKATS